jgi:hypothetical protein
MTRRLCAPLACALALLALVSACGGSSAPKTGPTTGLSIATIKHLNKIDTQKTLTECLKSASNPGVSPTVKPLLETECQYIRTGNNVGLHAIDRQVCQAEAAEQPEPERTSMRAQCKQL